MRSASSSASSRPSTGSSTDLLPVAGLHDLPVGHGSAGQDLRAARRAGRADPGARRRRARPAARRNLLRGRLVLLRARTSRRRQAALADVTCGAAGPDHRARGRHRRGRVDVRKLAARFYDPTEGRVLVDGHDLRDVAAARCARRWASCPRRASSSAARCATTSPSARARRCRRHRGGRAGARTWPSSSASWSCWQTAAKRRPQAGRRQSERAQGSSCHHRRRGGDPSRFLAADLGVVDPSRASRFIGSGGGRNARVAPHVPTAGLGLSRSERGWRSRSREKKAPLGAACG